MAFSFNWAPKKIPTQLKGQANLPEIEQPFDFNSYFTNLVNREEMEGYHPAQNFSVPNQQHGGNQAVNYAGYSPTTPMTEEDVINQNMAERQAGNADDMANWIQQGGTPQADAAAAAEQQAQQENAAKQQRIAEIEAEITEIRNRISERKMAMAANEDDLNSQLAGIEARKINSQDPTMFWRWKVGQDQQRELAKQAKSEDNTAKANAMIEIANDLDSIIVDDTMTSQDQKVYLSKLSNMKTLGEKAGVPKSVIDSINAKIKEVKGENKSGSEVQSQSEYKKGTKVENADKAADELLAKPDLTQGDIAKFKRDNPNISDGKLLELNKKHNELIDRDKKKNEAIKKARGLVGKKNLTSKEIEFMNGMKGFKKESDDFGNIWFKEVL